jgi:small nuclear ribonucleoprotein (snRNP)-like protein
MSIHLDKYLNQEVQIELRNGEGNIGVVEECRDSCFSFRFKIGNNPNYYNTQGYYSSSCKADPHDIVSIKPFTKTMKFTGLAQKHPHIDLNKFIGKTILIRLNKEYSGLSTQYIGKISGDLNIGGFQFTNSGKRSHCPTTQWITEIYEEGAFHIETKEIPDVDPEVEKAKEAVKNLSEEQIAQLLHSLKK